MSVLALLVLAPKKDCHPLSPPFPFRAAQQGRPGQTKEGAYWGVRLDR